MVSSSPSFVAKTLSALDSQELQAAIFAKAVLPVLDRHLASLSQALGAKVGDMIVDVKADFAQRMQTLEITELKHEIQYLRDLVDKDMVSASNQSKAATEVLREAVSSRSSKTVARKNRRLRAKSKYEYSRAKLLSVVPACGYDHAPMAISSPPGLQDSSRTSTCQQDLPLAHEISEHIADPFYVECGLPSLHDRIGALEVLMFHSAATQQAVNCEWEPLQLAEGCVEWDRDNFVFELKERDLASARACAPSEEGDVQGSSHATTFRVETTSFEASVHKDHEGGNASGIGFAPALDTADMKDATFVLEGKLAMAIEATTTHKLQSSEPWRAVRCVEDLRMAARHFASVARELPHWELDTIGRTLVVRDALASGRRLATHQIGLVTHLEEALPESMINQSSDLLKEASRFYREIGHFQ